MKTLLHTFCTSEGEILLQIDINATSEEDSDRVIRELSRLIGEVLAEKWHAKAKSLR